MEVLTDSERVRHSRRLVLEFLGSSVDVELAGPVVPDGSIAAYAQRYGADATRFGPSAGAAPAGGRDNAEAGHHHAAGGDPTAATVAQPVKVDNELYVRDYSRCILCYKCVEACGVDAQNTFAIAVAGRGFDARISTEWNVGLPDSACVYCGNCIGVCPTGALMFRSEHEMREAGTWDESAQTVTDTICPYCGVGCTLSLHVQDNDIVKVTSPMDSSVTEGHLCIKGRFGFQFVQNRAPGGGSASPAPDRLQAADRVRADADPFPLAVVPGRPGRDGPGRRRPPGDDRLDHQRRADPAGPGARGDRPRLRARSLPATTEDRPQRGHGGHGRHGRRIREPGGRSWRRTAASSDPASAPAKVRRPSSGRTSRR